MSGTQYPPCVDMLLVVDDPGDIRFASEFSEEAKIVNCVNSVQNGPAAMLHHPRGCGYSNQPGTNLILLDLDLHRRDAWEVHEGKRDDGHLKKMPFVLQSTTKAEGDIVRTCGVSADRYITKPISGVVGVEESTRGTCTEVSKPRIRLPRG